MFMFVYAALTVIWFGFAAPEMLTSFSTGTVLVGFGGTVLWLICTTCIAVYVIDKWH